MLVLSENNQWERMLKPVHLVQFNMLVQGRPGVTKENISENSYSAGRDLRLFPLNLMTFDVNTPTAST